MIYENRLSDMASEIVKISGLRVEARSDSDVVVAVDGASLAVDAGEIVGLIGESGSGKTTLIRSILGLHERNVSIVEGAISFCGQLVFDKSSEINDLANLRGKHIGMVFQSPRASLNPLMTVGSHVNEVLKRHNSYFSRDDRKARTIELLNELGLDAQRVVRSYPHQLSGGMCQRVAIAVAVATRPEMIIADECTSALDVTTQAEVVVALRSLKETHSTAMIFVSHDILLASELCDRLIVMQSGNVVEIGETKSVLKHPKNVYTRNLIRSVPRWN